MPRRAATTLPRHGRGLPVLLLLLLLLLFLLACSSPASASNEAAALEAAAAVEAAAAEEAALSFAVSSSSAAVGTASDPLSAALQSLNATKALASRLVVGTADLALALEEQAKQGAAAVAAAAATGSPQILLEVVKSKKLALFDVAKGTRFRGYTHIITYTIAGASCPPTPKDKAKDPISSTLGEGATSWFKARELAEAAAWDIRNLVAAEGDTFATAVVLGVSCSPTVNATASAAGGQGATYTVPSYVSGQWPAVQRAVPKARATTKAAPPPCSTPRACASTSSSPSCPGSRPATGPAAILPTVAALAPSSCRRGHNGTASSATPPPCCLASGTVAVDTSHVIAVVPQPGNTPSGYSVGPASVQAVFSLGGKSYRTTTDTGSPLLSVPCNTPLSQQNCGASADLAQQLNANFFAPNATQQASFGPQQCQALTDSDCYAAGEIVYGPGNTTIGPSCWHSQALQGEKPKSFHPAGTYVTGPVTFNTIPTCDSSTTTLSFDAAVACGESYRTCLDEACKRAAGVCPPPAFYYADQSCPISSNGGIQAQELGWNLAVPASSAPLASSLAVPNQVLEQGLIAKRELSFCWTLPPTATNCSAAAAGETSPSYNVLGPLLPKGVRLDGSSSVGALATAPLFCRGKNETANRTSLSSTQKFYALVSKATLTPPKALLTPPPPGSSLPPPPPPSDAVKRFGDSPKDILLDTGAGAEQAVDKDTYKRYRKFVDEALPYAEAAAKSNGFDIKRCNASSYCSGNYDKSDGAPACKAIYLDNSQESLAPLAAEILDSIWPSSLRIEFQGGKGAPAVMRTAFPRYLCEAGGFSGVVACSYVRPVDYFWVAGPFFSRLAGGLGSGTGGTLTHMMMSSQPATAANGTATPIPDDAPCGTMTYATAPVDCKYCSTVP